MDKIFSVVFRGGGETAGSHANSVNRYEAKNNKPLLNTFNKTSFCISQPLYDTFEGGAYKHIKNNNH